jgi:hypothetical protein
MKNFTTTLIIAAAALVTAGAASAQVLKADIPFEFQAGGKVMAAGTYQVYLRVVGGTVILKNANRNAAITAMPSSHIEGAEQGAKLVFRCVHGSCSLAQVWPGDSGPGLTFPTPKLDRNEVASTAVIHLRPNAAE